MKGRGMERRESERERNGWRDPNQFVKDLASGVM